MDKIKCRPFDRVKCGLVFSDCGTMWKVANYNHNDKFWICENLFDRNVTIYRTANEIQEIIKNTLDKTPKA